VYLRASRACPWILAEFGNDTCFQARGLVSYAGDVFLLGRLRNGLLGTIIMKDTLPQFPGQEAKG